MLAKLFIGILFIIAEISLGVYSLLFSESLLARFLFFMLSAVLICFAVIKMSSKILPFEENEAFKEEK
ncbi:hypothetical protein [Mesonia aquimarina]|uniref:hypothetical protein n=1 Tax=Mesonia aquimarina TaxID=1504967 RepID=UPI000EF5A50C|nr:hypothetical protein [Mesonia aquimarina]